MHPYEFNLSLRLTHPQKDLAEIYQKLSSVSGFMPGRIWKVGDERRSQQGERLEGNYDKSYCYFNFFNQPQKSTVESPSDVMERVLTQLTPFKNDLEEHTKSGGDLEFFVGLYVDSNSAEILRPDLMKKLGDLGIQLSLDIYPSEASNN